MIEFPAMKEADNAIEISGRVVVEPTVIARKTGPSIITYIDTNDGESAFLLGVVVDRNGDPGLLTDIRLGDIIKVKGKLSPYYGCCVVKCESLQRIGK